MLAKRKVTHIYYEIVRGSKFKKQTNLVKLENCIAKILTENKTKKGNSHPAFSFLARVSQIKKHTYQEKLLVVEASSVPQFCTYTHTHGQTFTHTYTRSHPHIHTLIRKLIARIQGKVTLAVEYLTKTVSLSQSMIKFNIHTQKKRR